MSTGNNITGVKRKLQKIYEANPNQTEINLENCNLKEIDEIWDLLIKFKDLKVLRMGSNYLQSLPTDMSYLENLQFLDITNNNIRELKGIMQGLLSLPALKHLFIDLSTEDEDEIIVTLTNLESFNGTPLSDVPEEEDEDGMGFGGYTATTSTTNTTNTTRIEPKENLTEKSAQEEPKIEEKKVRDAEGNVISLDNIDFEAQERLFGAVKSHLNRKGEWPAFSQLHKNDLMDRLANYPNDIVRQLNEILYIKRMLTNDCFDDIINEVQKKDKKLALVLNLVKDTYDGLLDEYYVNTVNVATQYHSKLHKLEAELNEADDEIRKFVVASELLEKEATDNETAKRKLASTFEEEKEKLVEEIGWLKAEKEKIKNKLRQYQIAQQKMSMQAQMNPRDILLQSVRADTRRKRDKLGSRSPSGKKTNKPLTLKQLREFIEEIYASKTRFDAKCVENRLPRETMEQHLYTYLNQKYGLKNLILDHASAIIAAVKKYSDADNAVSVFGKILRNEIDEEFRFVQKQLTETVGELLRVYLKGKFPYKNDKEINNMLHKRMNQYIYQEEWVDIIKYMYNKEDSVNVIVKVNEAIHAQQNSNRVNNASRGRSTREQLMKNTNRFPYADFLKVLLDFQLKGHERFLSKFVRIFRDFDHDRNGILNELEFHQLLQVINPNRSEDEIDELLQMMDPHNNQQITFSECVTFFSAELVRMMNTSKNEATTYPADDASIYGEDDMPHDEE